MGAWGYGSFQNDTAMDFVGNILNEKALKELVNKKKLDHYNYDEIRVSAEILVHLHKIQNMWVDQEVIDGLIRGLDLAIEDKSWHDTWRDEKSAKDMVKHLRKLVNKLGKLKGY